MTTKTNKIVIAPDSFKGSLSSMEVAQAASEGVREALGDCNALELPIADGGEGTCETLAQALGGEIIHASVSDPLGRKVDAIYAVCGKTAVVEISQASGMWRLRKDELNPFLTSSYGTGELIRDALARGYRDIMLCLGGSATNDCGMGVLKALGARFIDAYGNQLSGIGSDLIKVEKIDVSELMVEARKATFRIACDVDVPLCGPVGAAHTFGPQKGAIPIVVDILDMGMEQFAGIVLRDFGFDMKKARNAGAAGGVGAGLQAFLDAEAESGIETVLRSMEFDKFISGADLVITGEGCIDRQTALGKAASGVLAHAKKFGIPVAALAGQVHTCPEVEALGFDMILQTTPRLMRLEDAMKKETALSNIREAAKSIAQEML